MTLTFPLALGDFADLLLVKHFDWKLEEQQEVSGLAGGEILVADIAPRFWRAPVVLGNMSHQEAAEAQALIESLDGGLNTFYFHDPRRPYPAYDPTGAVLGAATIRIKAVASNKRVQLKGFPPGYQIRRADMFHRDFAINPVHRGLYRIATAVVTADINGETDWIEFRPHFVPNTAAVDDVVEFRRPAALCRLQPKSLNPGQSAGARNAGMSFEIRQVL